MAEASPSGPKKCMFCDKKLEDGEELHEHLRKVHKICIKLNLDKESQKLKTNFTEFSSASREEVKNGDNDELEAKLKTLKDILQQNFNKYIACWKGWIQNTISSEDFFHRIGQFFSDDNISVHNEFLLLYLRRVKALVDVRSSKEAALLKKVNDPSDPLCTALPDLEHFSEFLVREAGDPKQTSAMKGLISKLMMEKLDPPAASNDENDEPELPEAITLQDLMDVLQAHPEAFPVTSVYNEAMKHLIQRFAHVETKKRNQVEISEAKPQ